MTKLKRKSKNKKLAKKFNQDIDNLSNHSKDLDEVQDSEEELELQILQKILFKLIIISENDMKKLHYNLINDTGKGKDKELGLQNEKEMVSEWTTKLKPFICQNNNSFWQ